MHLPRVLHERTKIFFETASLHGLKYVGQPVASKFERIFWFLSFVGAIGCASYFINTMFEKFYYNRVIVSINAKSLSTTRIPFPTVTVCNMNIVNKRIAQAYMQYGLESEKEYANSICDSNNASTTSHAIKNQLKNEQYIRFILQMSPSCQDMLKICKWQLQEVDCNSVFSTVLTDIGACCSFNRLPLDYIFRNPTIVGVANGDHSNIAIDDWNFEKGYSTIPTNNKYPRSLKGSGLSVVLDTDIGNYYCSSTSSVGFKVTLTNPNEIPRVKNFAINFFPGMEASIAVSSVITDSAKNLKSIHISNRQCYFNNEKYLAYYRTYTINNCITECEANYTLERCGCLPHFLMTNLSVKVCQREHENCIAEVLEFVAVNEEPIIDDSKCKCLPSCFELNYSKHISYGRLSNTYNTSEMRIIQQSLNYFVDNMVVLNIYYPSTSTTRYTKSEIYGQLDLLANVGGLLAIFLGFSLLNAAEIIYQLLCRILPVAFLMMYTDFVERRRVFPFTK